MEFLFTREQSTLSTMLIKLLYQSVSQHLSVKATVGTKSFNTSRVTSESEIHVVAK